VKIGYAGSLWGIRGIFGETESGTPAQIRARLTEGLDVGGRRGPVELVIRERCNLIPAQKACDGSPPGSSRRVAGAQITLNGRCCRVARSGKPLPIYQRLRVGQQMVHV